jgi:hypothetical protein
VLLLSLTDFRQVDVFLPPTLFTAELAFAKALWAQREERIGGGETSMPKAVALMARAAKFSSRRMTQRPALVEAFFQAKAATASEQ